MIKYELRKETDVAEPKHTEQDRVIYGRIQGLENADPEDMKRALAEFLERLSDAPSLVMKGSYLPFDDGYGIVAYSYECPECGHINPFTDCETGCECGFSEPYVDPDDWYAERMSRSKKGRWV